jgi:hypothetical protein
MNEAHDDDRELISALIDGELDGQDRARAERLLAERPELRALADEFRALGERLRELPQLPVGRDLGESILRRAEREVLIGAAPSALADRRPSIVRRLAHWRPRSLRPIIYAGTAIAAGLVLMLSSETHPPAEVQPLRHADPATQQQADAKIHAPPTALAASDPAAAKPSAPLAAQAPHLEAAKGGAISNAAPPLVMQRKASALDQSSPAADLTLQAELARLGIPDQVAELSQEAKALADQQPPGKLADAWTLLVCEARDDEQARELAKVVASSSSGEKAGRSNAAQAKRQSPSEVRVLVASPQQLEKLAGQLAEHSAKPIVEQELPGLPTLEQPRSPVEAVDKLERNADADGGARRLRDQGEKLAAANKASDSHGSTTYRRVLIVIRRPPAEEPAKPTQPAK